MKIIVLGAGVTGLSIGRLLDRDHEVTILEQNSRIGGIAKTRQVDGITYHPIGGHCFNSKYPEIMSFVFSILPEKKWHKVSRLSKINLGSYEVDYPIEFSIQQIYRHDKELAYEIIQDFLNVQDDGKYNNLEMWFRKKFGNRLCDLYFIPYNTKIWGRKPSEMSHDWVEDKLPIPNKQAFMDGLIAPVKDTMPHSWFYYPNTNDQGTMLEALADGLHIETNTAVTQIAKQNDTWLVNGKYRADMVISTIPLNILPSLIAGVPDLIVKSARKLKYNKVSNVLWESRPTTKTWSYQPLTETIFHRYIHIGSFFHPVKSYTITEAIGERSYEEMVACGKKDPFLIKPLDHNVSDHAYVVFDENRDAAVQHIQSYLKQIGLVSIGRFGQWEYFNMDVCMKQSHDLYCQITKKQ
jgi:putative nucleotidyl-sugar pyranose mutase